MKTKIRKISIWLLAVCFAAGLFAASVPVDVKAAGWNYVEKFNNHVTVNGNPYVVGNKVYNGDTVSVEIVTDISFPLYEEQAVLKTYTGDFEKLKHVWFYWAYYDNASKSWVRYSEMKNITSDGVAPTYDFALTKEHVGMTFRFVVVDYNPTNPDVYYGAEFYVFQNETKYPVTLIAGSGGKVHFEGAFTAGSIVTNNFLLEESVNITAYAETGYVFDYWSVDAEDGPVYSYNISETYMITDPYAPNTLYAHFKYVGSFAFQGYYDINDPFNASPASIDSVILNGMEAKAGLYIMVNANCKIDINTKQCEVKNLYLEYGSIQQPISFKKVTDGVFSGTFKVPAGDFWIAIETEENYVPVKSVSLSPTAFELPAKSSKTIKATVKPSGATNKKLVWSSSNPSVAKVNSKGKVTAVKYGQPVTITAMSEDNNSITKTCTVQTRFLDVKDPKAYYFNTVYWAANSGIVSGLSGGTAFGPNNDCTRKQMMIILWKLSGSPEPKIKTMKFPDVTASKNSATYKAILWGIEQGIVAGFSDGKFHPEHPVTRKQAMIMLYRIDGRPEVTGEMKFTDVTGSKNSDSYKAILWGSQNKITGGYSDGTFGPDKSCLRKHIVTFIYKYADLYMAG